MKLYVTSGNYQIVILAGDPLGAAYFVVNRFIDEEWGAGVRQKKVRKAIEDEGFSDHFLVSEIGFGRHDAGKFLVADVVSEVSRFLDLFEED